MHGQHCYDRAGRLDCGRPDAHPQPVPVMQELVVPDDAPDVESTTASTPTHSPWVQRALAGALPTKENHR